MTRHWRRCRTAFGRFRPGEHAHREDEAEGEEEDHGEEDPHVWQSVPNAETMVENARDALIDVDPEGAATYRANAAGYLDELGDLQREMTTTLAAIPPERRVLVTNHDTFGYFAVAYDFGVLGDALASVTTAAATPPPRTSPPSSPRSRSPGSPRSSPRTPPIRG